MSAVAIGYTLQPDDAFLDLSAPLLDEVDYLEVAPETCWREDGAGRLGANGFHARFVALGAGRHFFVAHGVGLSLGTAHRRDAQRRRAWLARVAEDQRTFGFRWYTEHLGATSLDGRAVTLPLPLPMTAHAARVVRSRLAAMQRVVPDVGVENNVGYFLFGDPLDEPGFLDRVLAAPRTHLLLDLHNMHVMAENFGFAPSQYLARLDLARVIEIHLAGGRSSDARWLPSGRTLRLDSHDAAIPDAVWRLYEEVLPRCPRLRGVTVERMEGTIEGGDVAILRAELRRARRMLARRRRA